jgi:predicted cytidylate kinase
MKDFETYPKETEMVDFLNIALSGDVGTGTTTLGRNLASSLNWQHINAGEYFRAWHREKGVPLENVKEIPAEVNRELDERFLRDMQSIGKMVFESHLAGWLARDLSQTFKILCVADKEVTMARIASREGWDITEAKKFSEMRSKGLNETFGELYGVTNPYDPSLFDAVIDTTRMSVGEVLDSALHQFLRRLPEGHELARILEVD